MNLLQMADPVRFRIMTTEELRATFLLSDHFQPGQLSLTYVDLDRTVIGSAVPATSPLLLPTPDRLRARFFTERRELGVLNIGGAGTVTVDGTGYDLQNLDAIYIGRGKQEIVFTSANPAKPAEFYLLSYPSHAEHPTQLIRSAEAENMMIGSQKTANLRKITRLIHLGGAESSQLVMGFTELAEGSVWNTMPAHTHDRRSEVYLYFGLSEDQRVIHLMGPGNETRNIVVANKQAVVSPGWSIHSGVGTSNYKFCWGMGGENQEYADMDVIEIRELK